MHTCGSHSPTRAHTYLYFGGSECSCLGDELEQVGLGGEGELRRPLECPVVLRMRRGAAPGPGREAARFSPTGGEKEEPGLRQRQKHHTQPMDGGLVLHNRPLGPRAQPLLGWLMCSLAAPVLPASSSPRPCPRGPVQAQGTATSTSAGRWSSSASVLHPAGCCPSAG